MVWNEDSGEVGGGGAKIAWRLITVDKQYGKMKFGSLFGANPMVDDGEYCFALMPGYGTVCKVRVRGRGRGRGRVRVRVRVRACTKRP